MDSWGPFCPPGRRGPQFASHGGRDLPQWQIEVTGGDRAWYLLDVDKHTVWVQYAGAHPKATD